MASFTIRWRISEREWSLAKRAYREYPPGSLPDTYFGSCIQVLFGPVQLTYGEDDLFPVDLLWERRKRTRDGLLQHGTPVPPMQTRSEILGRTMSIAVLANELAALLRRGVRSLPDGQAVSCLQRDAQVVLYFGRVGNHMGVRSTAFEDVRLSVPEAAFEAGAQTFVWGFLQEVDLHMPELLEWQSYAPLREFSTRGL